MSSSITKSVLWLGLAIAFANPFIALAREAEIESKKEPAQNTCPTFFSKIGYFFLSTKEENELDQLVLQEIQNSFFVNKQKTPSKIKSWNKSLLKKLNELPSSTKTNRKPYLSSKELRSLMSKVIHHPVAGLCSLEKYDPTGANGFCFGRALSIYIEALRMGLDKTQIKKIWAVGQETGLEKWSFHVATMIRGKNGSWYVLDPKMRLPLPLKTWTSMIQYGAFKAPVQFFVSKPSRWSVYENTKPNKNLLYWDGYNSYFQDLMEESRREARELIHTLPGKE